MSMLLVAIIVLKFAGSLGQQSCPALGEVPASPPGCQWVVEQDSQGCRVYIRDCSNRYNQRCSIVNEVFWRCSSWCEPTCSNRYPLCKKSCAPPKCQCMGGYFRNEFGECVKEEQCPQVFPSQCNINEIFVRCSSLCEPSCSNQNPACPATCGPPRCQCKPGFVRDSSGRCIPPAYCLPPQPICPPNEEYVQCSSLCEPTCYTRPNEPCPLSCGPPKCQCKPGYVRTYRGCIPRYHCP